MKKLGTDNNILQVIDLSVWAANRLVLRGINIDILQHTVSAITGPSGVGKSTLLRCLNRLTELDFAYKVSGGIFFHGNSIHAPSVNPDDLRSRIGMIFQQPVVFPTTIEKNVLFGVRHVKRLSRSEATVLVERALREAALWDEVKDRLHDTAIKLSVGQQQRLCLARTLALDPEVILMDEPTSALDPRSTEAIEELMLQLKSHRTIVLVTHNMNQAETVADRIIPLNAVDGAGQLSK